MYLLKLMGQREENVERFAPANMLPGCTWFKYADGSEHVHGPGAIFEVNEILPASNGHAFGAGGRCVNEGCIATKYNISSVQYCPWTQEKSDAWHEQDRLRAAKEKEAERKREEELDALYPPPARRGERISLAHPPSVSVKVRQSGSVVVTVNLSRGGFTCFLKPPAPPEPDAPCTDQWSFGFAFRCPTDEPGVSGEHTAATRRFQWVTGKKRSCFAGTVSPNDRDRGSQEHLVRVLVIRALRSLRKSGALGNVRWWTKDSMDQAVKLLKEGPKAEVTYYYKVTYVDEAGNPTKPTEPPTETE